MGNTTDGDELFRYPEWQKALQEALVELDKEKLKSRIVAAEAAILKRQEEIFRGVNSPADERQAIEDALASLRVLKRHALGTAGGRSSEPRRSRGL